MKVYVFDKERADKCQLDDGHGGNVGLENHLRYLREEGGTPDCNVELLEDYDTPEDFFEEYPEDQNYYTDDCCERLVKEEIEDAFKN